MRQQLADATGVLGGQASERVLEIAEWLMAIEFGRVHQAHDGGGALTFGVPYYLEYRYIVCGRVVFVAVVRRNSDNRSADRVDRAVHSARKAIQDAPNDELADLIVGSLTLYIRPSGSALIYMASVETDRVRSEAVGPVEFLCIGGALAADAEEPIVDEALNIIGEAAADKFNLEEPGLDDYAAVIALAFETDPAFRARCEAALIAQVGRGEVAAALESLEH